MTSTTKGASKDAPGRPSQRVLATDKRGATDKRVITGNRGATDKRVVTGKRGATDKRVVTDKRGATDKRVVTDKREAIMMAALDLFVERGFHGTAVPEIADKAGVGAGTIYRYFANKGALVNALYRHEKQGFAERVLADFPKSSTARELFRTMWNRMATFAVANPKPFVFLELHHHAEYLDAESLALEQRMRALFTNVIVSAQSRGELKDGPPNLLMSIVMGAFIGVIRGCGETAQPLGDADWVLAERCVWEAVRA